MASNWDELERWMEGQRLPKGFEILREPQWVEQYVRRMMTKALPEAAGAITSNGAATCKVSQKFIHVKFKLPQNTDRDSLRLRVSEDQLQVDGLPGGGAETVKLPKLVLPRYSRASVRDSFLYVKLTRRQIKRNYTDTIVRWL